MHTTTFFIFMLIVACMIQPACSLGRSGAGAAETNRAKWNASHIENYRIRMRVDKTGHAGPMGNIVLDVQDGNSVSSRVDGEWYGGDIAKCAAYDTVPKMFDFIEEAAKRNPDVLDVSYDPTFGYPNRVRLDYNSRAIDDELSWEVLDFGKVEPAESGKQ
jgi:hypothetical protein